ncbi:hypothetical protein DNTS_009681 [Danionella cerebrum]|uniref:C2H2-type domain-containing protein n=1 Tax=Danionella cerebrum TaxID=2873325 RepID=A0A553PUJ2_9TELE|nr:hypothetical protein DNTS_009681 [Danionella translucida]
MPEGSIEQPLFSSVPRDCGHECRVCGITEVSLTDYANHISSPLHKQHVEDQKRKPLNEGQDEEYFDKDVVQLIEKRKEIVRKEKAAAKQAKADLEQVRRRQESRPRPRMSFGPWDHPFQSYPHMGNKGRGSNWQNLRFSSPERSRFFNPTQQVRCATWHAEGPPDLQMWGSVDRGRSLHNQRNFWSNGQREFGFCPPHSGKHFPSPFNWHKSYIPPLFKPQQKTSNNQTQSEQSLEESGGEYDLDKAKGLKAYRWAPYPPANLGDPSSSCTPQAALNKNVGHGFSKTSPDMERKSRAECGNRRQNSLESFSQESSDLDHFTQPSTSGSGMSVRLSKPPESGSCTNLKPSESQESLGSKSKKESHSRSKHATCIAPSDISEMLRKAKDALLSGNKSMAFSATDRCPKGSNSVHVKGSESNKSKKVHGNKSEHKNASQSRQTVDRCNSTNQEPLRATENSPQIGNVHSEGRPSLQSLHVSTSTVDHEEYEDRCGMEERPHLSGQDQIMDEGIGEESHSAPSVQAAGDSVASLSKLPLPACLQRDLNRHIVTKGKAPSHEPNLINARRIRNVSGSQKNESEKDSGLKPTLLQLISSSGSRRNVNWEQIYQEANRKRQGKGLPRFGIEMVPCGSESPNQMGEEDVPLSEGFHWESLIGSSPLASRKRSLSESNLLNIGPEKASSIVKAVDQLRDSAPSCSLQHSRRGDSQQPQVDLDTQDSQDITSDLQDVVDVDGCTSEPDLIDVQAAGKKRRACGDVASPGITNENRKNKRQKIKTKKERSQVDQLLAVSLREDELNNSLQAVDNSLIQARAALQAAYMEVQHLLMVKQQVTDEMSSLRMRRIEILQGMQGTKKNSEETSNTSSNQVSKITDIHVHPTSQNPSSNSTCLPIMPKQEPMSPVKPTSEDNILNSGPQSTSPVNNSTIESSQDASSLDHRLQPSPSKEVGSQEVVPDLPSTHVSPVQSEPLLTQPENSSGKRVRKLKKRKFLRKATGKEPEISESELDAEQPAPRPHRKSSRILAQSRTKEDKNVKDTSVSGAASQQPEEPKQSTPPVNKADSESSELEMMELPPPMPIEFVNLDSSETEEIPEKVAKESTKDSASVSSKGQLPVQQNLACNEVTSTSEMDSSSVAKACGRSVQKMMTSPPVIIYTGQVCCCSQASLLFLPSYGEDAVDREFEGHKEAVNAMQICNGLLYTCSGDRTIRAFNLTSRKCVAVFEGHSSKVNCLLVSCSRGLPERLYSGSSDQTIRCYDLKTTECVEQLSLQDRVLCLHQRWKIFYVGLANGFVISYSLRNNKQLDVFECHGPRAVSCLATAQEGSRRILLVGSYDATISVRDAKNGLLLRTLEGHSKTVLCMKVVNDLVFSGSSDQSVHAHNIHTGELVRIYKGHNHAVTVVAILGKVMVTACLDKLVRVYELQSHDRLQVYGGHSDMVMCMVIHKSMIYTGCYDGTVKAVKLNLIQNYRCWWYGCTLIFGVMEHLQQHLLNDHTSPAQQTFKCRWKNCDSFFTTRNSSKQGVHCHMQKHAEDDSKMEP